jgi:type IV fimbrial biogenesis protein FimT
MKTQRGFGLVESMVVVAIIVILAGAAAPAMQQFVANQRLKSAASDLFTDILRARSEAIKRNADITLSPSGDWSKGWTIPSPTNGNPALQSHAALSYVTINGPASLTYTAAGRVRGAANPTFNVSATNGSVRCITVDLGGRPSVQSKPC